MPPLADNLESGTVQIEKMPRDRKTQTGATSTRAAAIGLTTVRIGEEYHETP
jgi:hypothetical protein